MGSFWYWLIPAVLVAWVCGMYAVSFLATRPANLGVRDGKLAPCPASPNCVSTQAEDRSHHMDAIPFAGSTADAIAKLKQALAQLPRTCVVAETADYLHAECTSLVFRFVDDVEFWIDDANHVIHFRSASRVGRSDFGVNRGRMETIRKAFAGNEAAN